MKFNTMARPSIDDFSEGYGKEVKTRPSNEDSEEITLSFSEERILAARTYTKHVFFPARCCGRASYATQEAIDDYRKNFLGDWESDKTDAEIAREFDICLNCSEGINDERERALNPAEEFTFSRRLDDGRTVYSASHEIGNVVEVIFPAGYWDYGTTRCNSVYVSINIPERY